MRMTTAARLTPVLLILALLLGCSQKQGVNTMNGPTAPDNDFDQIGSLKGRPSTYGNCLSMPVIFAEGYGLTGADPEVNSGLRGTPGSELFVEPYDEGTTIDGYPVYQNPSVNEWQADWAEGSSWNGPVPVELDWSDNLVRQTWNERSKVRVEVILTTAPSSAALSLQGYNMYSLGGAQLDEVFVTNTTRYVASTATVYSNVARLTIQKLNAAGGTPVATTYNSACYEGYFVDGPIDAYSGEVNMGGKCIYGFNWDVGASLVDVKSGWYRLTFSLDASANYTDASGVSYSYPRNTVITGLNPGDLPGTSDPDVVIYPPTLISGGHASELEIYVKPKGSGKN